MTVAREGGRLLTRRDVLRLCTMLGGTLLLREGFGPRSASAAPRIGDTLPSVALPDMKGDKVSLPDGFKGKVVLVHFWASWCSFCEKEMKAIESMRGRYGEKGLAPFSVNVGEDRGVIEPFLAKMGVSYPVLLDPASATARLYGVTGLPTTFISDRDGRIRFKVLGEISQDGLEKVLARLL